MKALTVKRSGWSFKLAKLGDFPESGIVTDRGIAKQNNLLYKLWMRDAIQHHEYVSRRQETDRDANFCEFSRAIVFGLIKILFAAVVISALSIFVVGGTIADIVWIVDCLKGTHPPKWLDAFEAMGVAVWGIVAICFLGFLVSLALKSKLGQDDNPSREAEAIKEKLRKRELRQAFWGAVRNKTCFKMNIQ
jgi:hypothetical protein